jgi:hypothetical protein
MIYEYGELQWNDIDRLKQKNSERNPSVNLSTTNSTWTDLGINLGLYGERLATNQLSHGMAFYYVNLEGKVFQLPPPPLPWSVGRVARRAI